MGSVALPDQRHSARSTFMNTPTLGDKVRMKRSCPNYDAGQIGTLTRFSGSKSGAIWWVDFGVQRQWSHGRSESTGCWVARAEFECPTSPGAHHPDCTGQHETLMGETACVITPGAPS